MIKMIWAVHRLSLQGIHVFTFIMQENKTAEINKNPSMPFHSILTARVSEKQQGNVKIQVSSSSRFIRIQSEI
jgi:hypothetical protein